MIVRLRAFGELERLFDGERPHLGCRTLRPWAICWT